MTDSRHIPQEELALFAMQALAPDEAARLREHVGACSLCRDELALVSGDLALLALSAEQRPLPKGARDRFLARIHADAQKDAAPAPAPQSATPTRKSKRAFSSPLGIAWAAVGALAIVVIVLGVRIGSLDRQLKQESAALAQQNLTRARAQAVLDLLTAPAAKHVELTAAKSRPAPAARAVYLASKGALLMQASNLDAVPAGKTYELWVIPTQGAPIPAGLFRPDVAGNASVVLPEIPKGIEAKAFGVTVEQAGGASTPTAPIVLEGAVPAGGE